MRYGKLVPRSLMPFLFIALGLFMLQYSLFAPVPDTHKVSGVIEQIRYAPISEKSTAIDIELRLAGDYRIYQIHAKYINHEGTEPQLLDPLQFKLNVKQGSTVDLVVDADDFQNPRIPWIKSLSHRRLVSVLDVQVNGMTHLALESYKQTQEEDLYFGLGFVLLGLFMIRSLLFSAISYIQIRDTKYEEFKRLLFWIPILGIGLLAGIYFLSRDPLLGVGILLTSLGLAYMTMIKPRMLISKWRATAQEMGFKIKEIRGAPFSFSFEGELDGYKVGGYLGSQTIEFLAEGYLYVVLQEKMPLSLEATQYKWGTTFSEGESFELGEESFDKEVMIGASEAQQKRCRLWLKKPGIKDALREFCYAFDKGTTYLEKGSLFLRTNSFCTSGKRDVFYNTAQTQYRLVGYAKRIDQQKEVRQLKANQ